MNTEQSIRATVYAVTLLLHFKTLNSKPVRRLAQASVHPLLADRTFWITALMIVRCFSLMEALRSAFNVVSGASGWTEVTGTGVSPSLEGDRLPELGSIGGSGAVFG